MFRYAFTTVLVIASMAPVTIAAAPAATSTHVMLFNLTPAGAYHVRRNGVVAGTSVANPAGVIVYPASVNSGDRIEFSLTGIDPVDPSRPTGFVAAGNNQGCVVATWNPPSGAEYVTEYSLSWGATPGAYTDSVMIRAADIAKGAKWASSRCGFANGSYVFALRAHNAFDRWSARSQSSSTTITNQDAQPPLPPTNVRVSETSFGCATVTWTRSSDPAVTGYRISSGTRPRSQTAYTDSLDVANVATGQRCGLAAGNHYFSVRAFNATGELSTYSAEVVLAAQGTDTAPPSISQRTPAAGASGVPINANIFFVASDDKTGVNPSSIVVRINGQAQSVTTSSSASGIAVQCDPPTNFAPDADVQVDLSVADRATPPNIATRSYSFHTGTTSVNDNDAPGVTSRDPASGAQDVDARPTIEVQITDDGLGIDLASIVMEVNGDAVAYTIEGSPASALVRYRPDAAFSPGARVDVHVEACDRAPSPNCAAPLDYHFTVRGSNVALDGAGAIVPNGYWANDPSRPLEIRNLPSAWSVRIFDTSGVAVRCHRNHAEGVTWVWNFRNDDGMIVAPALYLVRVTDGGGNVQTTGKFLVQSPQ